MLSVIVITKNEEDVLKDCLESIKDIADEIIVVDSFSTDQTARIAKDLGAKLIQNNFVDFSNQRNFAVSKAQGDWILFLDADERATEEFKKEVKEIIKNFKVDNGIGGYFVKRRNLFFGKDWGLTENVQKLFYKKFLIEWQGAVHETPKIKGKFSQINSYIIHQTHRNLSQMLEKTNKWSEYEAELRLRANHPKMSWWRFLRIMVTGFSSSYFSQKGYKNGTAGLIEGMYQSFSMFITYAKLWEKQKIN